MPQIIEFRDQVGTLTDILEAIRENVGLETVYAALIDIAPDDGDPRTTRFYCADHEEFGYVVLSFAVKLIKELPENRPFRFSALMVLRIDESNAQDLAALAIVKEDLKAQVLPEQLKYQHEMLRLMRQSLKEALEAGATASVPAPSRAADVSPAHFPMTKPKIVS